MSAAGDRVCTWLYVATARPVAQNRQNLTEPDGVGQPSPQPRLPMPGHATWLNLMTVLYRRTVCMIGSAIVLKRKR